MSSIAFEFFRHSPLLALPVLSLVLFMSAFVVSILRAVLASQKRLQALSELPFQGEESCNE